TPHGLHMVSKIDQVHPDRAIDPLGIICSVSKLTYQFLCVYPSFARILGVGY
ncbi:hypothetical protein CFC21_105222, partial [Triticum aestivum]